jgi:hypothetical protein
MVAPGYCCLIVFSVLGCSFEVFFCSLHSESKCGADLVIVVGAQYVRFVFCSLLVFRVQMLLFPLGGMKRQRILLLGCHLSWVAAAFLGRRLAHWRRRMSFPLLSITRWWSRFIHRLRCVSVVVRAPLLAASTTMFGASCSGWRWTGVLAPVAAGRICCFGVASVIPKLLRVLSVKWGCTGFVLI